MTEFDRTAPEAEIVSHPLEHLGVVEWAGVSEGLRERSPPESFDICTDPAPVRKAVEEELRVEGANRSILTFRKKPKKGRQL